MRRVSGRVQRAACIGASPGGRARRLAPACVRGTGQAPRRPTRSGLASRSGRNSNRGAPVYCRCRQGPGQQRGRASSERLRAPLSRAPASPASAAPGASSACWCCRGRQSAARVRGAAVRMANRGLHRRVPTPRERERSAPALPSSSRSVALRPPAACLVTAACSQLPLRHQKRPLLCAASLSEGSHPSRRPQRSHVFLLLLHLLLLWLVGRGGRERVRCLTAAVRCWQGCGPSPCQDVGSAAHCAPRRQACAMPWRV